MTSIQTQTQAPVLPASLRVGAVELTVTDLDRSVDFYEYAIGLRLHRREDGRAALGAGGEDLLVLVEDASARRAGRHAGLYHFALLHPSRLELARAAHRLAATRTRISGASDHGISEAIYLPDPDGNGIELAADRGRERWGDLSDPTALGGPEPLDVAGLLALVADEEPVARRRPRHGRRPRAPARRRHRARARVLPRRDRLRGDDPATTRRPSSPPAATTTTSASTSGAATASPPSPAGTVGLRHWTIVLPAADAAALRERVIAAGAPYEERARGPARARPVGDRAAGARD